MNPVIGKILSGRESLNDLILESLLEGVAIIDRSRTIVFVNDSASRMLGTAAADILGNPYDLTFFKTDKTKSEQELAVCPVQFALTEGTASHVRDGVFVRADGADVFVEYVCTPIIEAGEICGAAVSFQDVSQRREFEQDLSEARDAALESARTKAAFLANVSHEIRTPLSGIVGTANLLGETELTDEQLNYVGMLKQSIASLLETVNDILDFSKLEAGKVRLRCEAFELRELVGETLNLFRSSAEAKGLALEAEFARDIAKSYLGDAGRLRQILNNLISNAVKFTSHGSVRVTVAPTEPGSGLIRFEVADTGIGIGEGQINALFRPFTQGDISSTRKFGGTGLGLAISRELVELMGGGIGVESSPGEGARFWFTVPLAPGLSDAGDIHVSETPANSIRVLLVEDNLISSEIIRKMLELNGCRVTVAENGAKGVELAAARDFDLILMDCQMPEVDGYAATRMIRDSSTRNRSTAIIALSAHAEEIERDKCIAAGMDDFLCKPLTGDSLLRTLEKYCGDFFGSSNLDLKPDLLQHFITKHVTPKVLENFSAIESRGETNFVEEIFGTYFRFAGDEISKIEKDAASGDLNLVGRRAHTLKGSSANVGLSMMADLCAELELAAGSAADVSEPVARLSRKFNEIRAQIAVNI